MATAVDNASKKAILADVLADDTANEPEVFQTKMDRRTAILGVSNVLILCLLYTYLTVGPPLTVGSDCAALERDWPCFSSRLSARS